jgi:hypothetical protein
VSGKELSKGADLSTGSPPKLDGNVPIAANSGPSHAVTYYITLPYNFANTDMFLTYEIGGDCNPHWSVGEFADSGPKTTIFDSRRGTEKFGCDSSDAVLQGDPPTSEKPTPSDPPDSVHVGAGWRSNQTANGQPGVIWLRDFRCWFSAFE